MRILLFVLLILTLIGPLWIIATGRIDFKADYRTANRDSAHLAPDPHAYPDAVIQVYSARAFNWRGVLATHGWIAVKPKDAPVYTVYQVVGWRVYYGQPALAIEQDIPDRNWYGQKPTVIFDLRGEKAQKLIPKIDMAAKGYRYANIYTLWPGPNSNTFPAYIGREVLELGLAMPAEAIGKDYIARDVFFAKAPSGTGYQFSLRGVLGIMIAKKEGIEINLLGFVYGISFSPLGILLPGVGKILLG